MVTPKNILQVQPFFGQLGTHFPANQAYTDSGYVFVGSLFEGTAANVLDFTTVKPYLESGDRGIVQYGSHGASNGSLSIEWRTDATDAATRIQWLVDWQYFQQGELYPATVQTSSGATLYAINAVKEYWDSKPAPCDVAIVAACYGASSGDFRASHKLGGTPDCTNVQHRAAHTALMTGMKTQNVKTLFAAYAQLPQQIQLIDPSLTNLAGVAGGSTAERPRFVAPLTRWLDSPTVHAAARGESRATIVACTSRIRCLQSRRLRVHTCD
jgi:hypothetical protein